MTGRKAVIMNELFNDLFADLLETDFDLSLFDGCTSDKSETNTNDYATWAAEMDAKLKAAIAEDELDLDDEYYVSYKGVVKPRVYFNGVELDTENMPTYDEIIDNHKPIYPVFE